MGRLVAIDFGIQRCGLACTDPEQLIASGLDFRATKEVIPYLIDYCKTETVDTFIVGQPLQKDGSDSAVAKEIKKFVTELQAVFPKHSITRYDERFTSKIAFQTLVESGVSKKKRREKGLVDKISATLILQSYMSYQSNTL